MFIFITILYIYNSDLFCNLITLENLKYEYSELQPEFPISRNVRVSVKGEDNISFMLVINRSNL